MIATRVLVLAGSIRTGALSVQLAAAAEREFALAGADVRRISLADYPMPIYDGDYEARSGPPLNAINLKRMIGSHDGVFIVTPEYNASIPPLLKNAIDWVTRVREGEETLGQVFRERVFAIASTSDGRFGGLRGLITLRQVLELGCGASVVPRQLALPLAHRAFDSTGHIVEERDAAALRNIVADLIISARRFLT